MPLAPSLFCTMSSGLPAMCLTMCLAKKPALDVGRAAGREVDQKRQPLALVERLLGARRGGGESRARRQ